MKTIFLSVVILFACHSTKLSAWTQDLPDIPTPKLTACEALTIASKRLAEVENRKDAAMFPVAVEWCKAAGFRPRMTDGTLYQFAQEPEEWSWIVTFADSKAIKAHNLGPMFVIRVRDNGKTEIPVAERY
jgi:hypothetical protein